MTDAQSPSVTISDPMAQSLKKIMKSIHSIPRESKSKQSRSNSSNASNSASCNNVIKVLDEEVQNMKSLLMTYHVADRDSQPAYMNYSPLALSLIHI